MGELLASSAQLGEQRVVGPAAADGRRSARQFGGSDLGLEQRHRRVGASLGGVVDEPLHGDGHDGCEAADGGDDEQPFQRCEPAVGLAAGKRAVGHGWGPPATMPPVSDTKGG